MGSSCSPAKNSLNLADARQLENAFQARLAELELGADNAEPRPIIVWINAQAHNVPRAERTEVNQNFHYREDRKKRACPLSRVEFAIESI